jgi:hypothetical protein
LYGAKEITPELHVAGGLTARQIKYAYEGGFKSIISLYSEANPGNYGSESYSNKYMCINSTSTHSSRYFY